MKEIKKLIDVSCFTGNWPFIHLRYGNIEVLEKKLAAINVTKAFISPVEAILEQDPIRANREMLKLVTGNIFSPVPVVDLSYQNWEDCMDIAVNDGRVKMVKLIPNYHMYKMYEKDMDKLVAYAKSKGLVISIQLTVEDPRGQYPLMKVERVHHYDVVKTLALFPEQTFILHNSSMNDLPFYMGALKNVYVDISYLERQDIMAVLHKEYSLDKFLFASHMPFFFPDGSLNKLKYANVDIDEVEKVAYKNATGIFNL